MRMQLSVMAHNLKERHVVSDLVRVCITTRIWYETYVFQL